MTLPAIAVILNFSSGPSFGQAMIIGSGVLGVNILADSVTVTADVSDTVQAVNIQRGRNVLSDVFQTGTCSVVIADQDGAFNPNNTASPYYGLIQPLRKITITATDPSTGIIWPMFAGYTTQFFYQQSRDVGIVSTTTITAVDGFRLANLATLTTVAGSAAGDLASTRITQILDAIAWPASMRDIDTAATTVQANPTASATALAKLQQCTDSEYGALYIDASGNMVMQNRAFTSSSIGGTPTVFADDGTGIPYSQVKFLFNDDLVYNSGSVTRIGGTAQTSENVASVALYFKHSYNRTDLIMQTDAVALDYVRAYIASRQATTTRTDMLSLNLNTTSTAGVTAALQLDYFDPIKVKSTQPAATGTSTLDKTLQIFGVSHNVTPNNWVTTFTTLEPIIDAFIIGDPNNLYDILGTSVLSY
ncbi:hypothetical protein UFOVP1145_13 [uncultured Caudovirales phage]|uniref:Uncharacterized protein n=1 Tax=uncultured Caudovirales phage TaxID=2100421 RepID=A0A6J5QUV9_9CAUD|nr:hypothetical protein UFOVP1145_13 [uncultured Caudovirales phage]